MVEISSDVIRGYNDTMILYILRKAPSYGYEISKQIKQLSDGKYVIKETTLYSAFTRMEKKHMVSQRPIKLIVMLCVYLPLVLIRGLFFIK